MTVREIIVEWLEQNGYDGLCNVECGCGCGIADLMPCENDNNNYPVIKCKARHKVVNGGSDSDFL